MRDLPDSLDLLALGCELLLDELLPLLPAERRRDVHLIATVMAIVAREAKGEGGWQQEVAGLLGEFYGDRGTAVETEAGLEPDGVLLRRLAQDLRNGAFETSPSRAAAARAILWRLTIAKLREGNPHFLAANGFNPAGDEGA